MRFILLLLFPFTVFILCTPFAFSKDKIESPQRTLIGFEPISAPQPLFDFGVGGGVLETSNYPASSERNLIALASPYFVYRGDVIRIGDGGGLRAVVMEKSDFELDVTFGGAFPANNADNSIRSGMPELDLLLEVGPQLVYKIKDYEFAGGGDGRLKARFKTRAAFSTDFTQLDNRGYVIEPTLSYQQRGRVFEDTGLNVSLSSTFASENFQAYFYDVPPEFSTDDRMQYEAEGGYLGTELSVSISFPVSERIRGFFSGTTKFYQGAANMDSPLFEKDITYSVGLGFLWRIYESDARASW